jgi:hypothetical protein
LGELEGATEAVVETCSSHADRIEEEATARLAYESAYDAALLSEENPGKNKETREAWARQEAWTQYAAYIHARAEAAAEREAVRGCMIQQRYWLLIASAALGQVPISQEDDVATMDDIRLER